MNVPTISAGAVRALAERSFRSRASETAFQAVLVAVAHAVQRAAESVQAAEASALNLAQQQKVAAVAEDLAATAEALRAALNAQGRCLLDGRPSLRDKVKEARVRVRESFVPRKEPGAASWWFALSEAVEALDDAAAQVDALADAQPAGAPAAALGREVAARLDAHRQALLAEAERWVG
jgi:hypothetical protein